MCHALGTMYATQPIRFINCQYVSRCAACHHHLIDDDGCNAHTYTPYTLVQREWMHHTSDVWYHQIELTCETIRITAIINACVRMLAPFFAFYFFPIGSNHLNHYFIVALGISFILISSEPMFRCHAFVWMFYKKKNKL